MTGRRQQRLYICTVSNWEGDSWTAVDGPFPSRKAAEAMLPKYRTDDLKAERHAAVFSRTELGRERLYSLTRLGDERLDCTLEGAHQERDALTQWHFKCMKKTGAATVTEMADLWGLDTSTIRTAIAEKRLPAMKFGKTWVVKVEDMVAAYGEPR